jgi:hypothetical protein
VIGLSRQHLPAMLAADPPVPYAETSATSGIAAAGIGPFRRWCLGAAPLPPAGCGDQRCDQDTMRS